MKAAMTTVAAISLVALLGGGWTLWRSTSVAQGSAADGPSISIEVVPPTEPDLAPRPILAVGALNDGYEHNPERLEPPAPLLADETAWDTAWLEPTPPLTATPVTVVTGPAAAPVRRIVQLPPDDYSFGFDRPLPETIEQSTPIDPTGVDADINDAR